jgi:hypothetical protein
VFVDLEPTVVGELHCSPHCAHNLIAFAICRTHGATRQQQAIAKTPAK